MQLKFFPTYEARLMWTFIFVLFLLGELSLAYLLLMSPFDPIVYVVFTAGTCIFSFSFFHFLRSWFCPYVQISDHLITVSGLYRQTIPMRKVSVLKQLSETELEVHYKDHEDPIVLKLEVAAPSLEAEDEDAFYRGPR